MRIITAAAIAAIFGLAACSGQKGPGDVVVDYMKDIDAGHTADALDLVDPAFKQIAGPMLGQFIADAEGKMKKHGGLRSVRATSTTIDGDNATVEVEAVSNDGQRGTSEQKVRRVDGRWYVSG